MGLDAKEPNLPEVVGRHLEGNLQAFERRCRVNIAKQEDAIAPDNGLMTLLADAVRLAREYCDVATEVNKAALSSNKQYTTKDVMALADRMGI